MDDAMHDTTVTHGMSGAIDEQRQDPATDPRAVLRECLSQALHVNQLAQFVTVPVEPLRALLAQPATEPDFEKEAKLLLPKLGSHPGADTCTERVERLAAHLRSQYLAGVEAGRREAQTKARKRKLKRDVAVSIRRDRENRMYDSMRRSEI